MGRSDSQSAAVMAWTAFGRAALVLALLVLAGLPLRAQPAVSPDDTARFLAGLPVAADSPLAPLTRDAGWLQHQRLMDSTFAEIEKRQLSKMRTWAAANVTARQPVLFYMFSGPDFLHPDAFFPDAETYVLAALEPAGTIPDLIRSRDSLPGMLTHLRSTMRSSLAFSFFITKQMKEELSVTPMRGTLPILYVSLARTGKTIREAAPVHIDEKGAVRAGGSARSGASGVRIVFSGADNRERTLYYFTTNIANDGFRRSGFAAFCEELGRGDMFLKSASYLLHQNGFTHVRDFILTRGATIVQDDSGIPVAKFDPGRWDIRAYGRASEPIGEFANYPQPTLKEFYRRHMQGPIDFGFGYRHRANESSLVVAINKDQPRLEATSTVGTSGMAPRDRPAPAMPAPAAPQRRERAEDIPH